MIKDRLPQFQEEVQKCDEGESISLMHYFSVIDMKGPFMGDFFYHLNVLRSNIDKLADLVDQVDHLHRTMLALNTIPGTKEQLEETMHEVKLLGTDVRMKLQRMNQMQELDSLRKRRNVQQRIVDAQTDACTKYFCITMNRYYELVVNYQNQCKARLVRQLEIGNIKKTDAEVEEILCRGRLSLFPEITMKLQEARQQFDEMKYRHSDLCELEDDLEQLRDMFFDLSYLLNTQNESIHSIEEELSLVQEHIEQDPIVMPARKHSRFFFSRVHVRLSRKKYLPSIGPVLLRLFLSCWHVNRVASC